MAYSVLIVDDSPAMRKFISRVLTVSGLDLGLTLEAGDGRQAIDVLHSSWVDLVLTDINMPGMNGEELLGELSRDSIFRSIPVMVVSTDHSPERVERMMALGARAYLTKPFLPERLRDAIEKMLGGDSDVAN